MTAHLALEHMRDQIQLSERDYIASDDSILDKNFPHKIQQVKRQ